MKAIFPRLRPCWQMHTPFREVRQLLWVLFFLLGITFASAQVQTPPSWWAARGVFNGAAAMDYAAANQGQLKNFARAARDEMLAKGMIATGHLIDQMVERWLADATNAKDYAAVNLGQLKAVAKPFYDQLFYLKQLPSESYPWQGASAPARDHAAINLGQLKNVFSFQIGDPLTRNVGGGATAQFWTATLANNGLVSTGILAGSQTLRYYYWGDVHGNVDQRFTQFQAGTPVVYSDGNITQAYLDDRSDLAYGYLNQAYQRVSCKGGSLVHFDALGNVSLGTLAEDQELYYRWDRKANCEGGSEVKFLNHCLSSGTLAEDWVLYYQVDRHAKCEAGTVATFLNYYLSSGTLAENQELYYNASDKAIFKAGELASFANSYGWTRYLSTGTLADVPAAQPLYYGPHGASYPVNVVGGKSVSFSSNSSYPSYYLSSQVTLAGDQDLLYGPSRVIKLKNGSKVSFSGTYITGAVRLAADPLQQPAAYAWNASFLTIPLLADTDAVIANEYVKSGTLAVQTQLSYGQVVPVELAAGSPVEFRNGTSSSTRFFIGKGTLATNQLLTYGTVTGYTQAWFKAGTEIQASSDNRVTSGVLASDLAALYGEGRTVNLAAHLPVTFTTTAPVYAATGSLTTDQPLFYTNWQSMVFEAGVETSFSLGLISSGRPAYAQPVFYMKTQVRNFPGNQMVHFNSTTGLISSTPLPLTSEDSDNDGFIDLFEQHVFGGLQESPSTDFNGNGRSNQADMNFWAAYCGVSGVDLLGDENLNGLNTLEELMLGVHPINAVTGRFLNPATADSDGDGVPDAQDAFPFDPHPLSLPASGPPPVINLLSPAGAQPVP